MADLHIEEFYKDAALVLAQLYAAFPRKTSVYVEDIAGADTPDEFGLHSKRHLACFGAMVWLAEERWIRYTDTIGQTAIDQAILTQATFTLLSGCDPLQLPSGPAGRPPVEDESPLRIDLIRAALKTGNSIRISQIVKQTLFST